ncbi:hypothetical protein BGZ96_006173 [Linnemannia gamsii]|uniref:T6SS Phospholipase effector Tle1-like catalytic domain-containing protein n=1 Tax=Linnemannia gamsii TaxID=64522 RepID=A0ABQ7K439_9FUNG|nr:hypothetical protein BGZ96_006173 [Linnemannia gamsii]
MEAKAKAPASTATTTKQKLIVLCDRTWCGSEDNTESNIFLLARMIGIDMAQQTEPIEYENRERGAKACYFLGSGLGSTFLEYLFNGATGSGISKVSIEVFSYNIQHFSEPRDLDVRVYSRQLHRAVCAGLIDSCGIIKKTTTSNGRIDDRTIRLCNEVYKIYCSREPEDHPKATTILGFKTHASYDVPTPVKFMGLLDTVGSRGIPRLGAGISLTYPEFHDQKVPSVVDKYTTPCPSTIEYGALSPAVCCELQIQTGLSLRSSSVGSLVAATILDDSGSSFCEMDRTGLNLQSMCSLVLY